MLFYCDSCFASVSDFSSAVSLANPSASGSGFYSASRSYHELGFTSDYYFTLVSFPISTSDSAFATASASNYTSKTDLINVYPSLLLLLLHPTLLLIFALVLSSHSAPDCTYASVTASDSDSVSVMRLLVLLLLLILLPLLFLFMLFLLILILIVLLLLLVLLFWLLFLILVLPLLQPILPLVRVLVFSASGCFFLYKCVF